MRIFGLIPFFLSSVNPNSLVMMMVPVGDVGMYPTVFISVSESVSGSSPHDGALERTFTDADAALADELPVLVFATVVNV